MTHPSQMQFRCSTCGSLHEGSPSFSFHAPYYFREGDTNSELTSDTCVIGDDHFIRACLEIPIHGIEEPFLWGIWISIGPSNFRRYLEVGAELAIGESYFGWFSNQLPYYSDTLNLKTRIHPRAAGIRPWVELEPTDHPLAIDYLNGIDEKRAAKIAEMVLHLTNDGHEHDQSN